MRCRQQVNVVSAVLALSILGAAVSSGAAELAEQRGRIAGVVVRAVDGKPIAGAYVGVGDFGDAGGSNLGRFEKEGHYAYTETDAEGRFVLKNITLGKHPLVVTHPEFVRHDQTATAGVDTGDSPEAEVRVPMQPAATIRVTAVGADGKPVSWPLAIRLEALDGHAFIPPGRQRHLSSFASPAWIERRKTEPFAFTELAPGEYCLDAIDMRSVTTTYYGGVASVEVRAGETKEVEIQPAGHQNSVRIGIPRALPEHEQIRPVLVISRNPGLLVWLDEKLHGLEDPRLGRIVNNPLVLAMPSPGGEHQVKNLPPGTYAVIAGLPISLGGAKVEVLAGADITADVPWRMPDRQDQVSRVGLYRLGLRVRLEDKQYTASELCTLLSAKTESRPEFRADRTIEDTKLELPEGERSIWEVVEAVYLATGWQLDEEEPNTVVFRSAAAKCSVAGKVVDAEGAPVASAAVVLFDQATGMPFVEGARLTLTEAYRVGPQPKDLAYTVTDAQGRFCFDDVREGEYRLVAQSWPQAESIRGIIEVNGEGVRLHGVAEHVRVSAELSPPVVIRPLGTGVLRLDEKMGNDWTLLVLSTAPPRGDPALGFAGWGGELMRHLIGGNRMPRGKTTVEGLPEGKVHIVLFANDNNPGFGAGEVDIRPGKITEVYVPIVAGWSDGHHDPPERLRPLFQQVKSLILEKDLSVARLLEAHGIRLRGQGLVQAQEETSQHLATEIVLPGGRKTTFGDFMAAVRYVELQRHAEQRKQRSRRRADLQQSRSLLADVDAKGSYEEAFFELYRELGENYPCFELKGIDWRAVGEELLPRAKEVENDEQFGLLCLELVARLEDSHAQLGKGTIDPPSPPFPQWDPGLACLIDDRGKPVVYSVDRDGPAEAAGVKIGMTIAWINGQAAGEAIDACMQRTAKYWGFSSRRYLRYQAARWFVRQMERGATVALGMQAPDGKTQEFEIPATLGVRYLPRLPVAIEGISDAADVSWKRLADDVGYIYVRRIRGDLIEKLDEAVGELKDARGLIVDVRGNSGGGFDAHRSHRNFAPDDPEESQRPRSRGPMALLIDARCISAGEGWASWFVAKQRARVFGETTAGASSRKRTYTLANGLYSVRFPVKAYRGSLDRPIERRGLEPDVPLMQNAQDLAAGRDTVLEAARRHLLETR